MTKTKRVTKRVDWEAVQRDYRLGSFTLRELAAKHGVSAGQISKCAKRYNWVKDFRDEVQSRMKAMLLSGNSEATIPTPEDVGRAAQRNARAVEEHASISNLGIRVARTMLERVEALLRGDVVALPCVGAKESLADVMVKASQALSRFIPLVRQAHNIGDDSKDAGDVVAALRNLTAQSSDGSSR